MFHDDTYNFTCSHHMNDATDGLEEFMAAFINLIVIWHPHIAVIT
jgi:hypothetical protein